VPLVDRYVNRLADRAAGMVEPRRRISELHEVLEVDERRVASPPVQVRDERGPVGRREDNVVATNGHGVARVAAVHLERRRSGSAQLADQAGIELDPLAVHPCAG